MAYGGRRGPHPTASPQNARFVCRINLVRCTDAQTMDILSLRVAVQDINEEMAPILLEVDAAAEVLERTDEGALHEEQSSVRRRTSERAAFRASYAERRRVVCPMRPSGASVDGKGQGRGRGGGRRGPSTGAAKMPTSVSQATAKQFCPEGGTIWRGLTRGEWCGHYPPNARIRSRWADKGEEAAMRDVLFRLWGQHATMHGLEFLGCCPFVDLLRPDPAPPSV